MWKSHGEEMPKTLSGRCFCGAVHYAVADAFTYAMNCHCSNCRRTTGSAFKPFAGIERGEFAVTQGEDKLMTYGDDKANDIHCRVCGSLLCALDPSHEAHLRRLQGAVVHHHRQPAAVSRISEAPPALTAWRESA